MMNFNVEMIIVGLIAFFEDNVEEASKYNFKGHKITFYNNITIVGVSKRKSTQVKMRVQIKRISNEYSYQLKYKE